MGSFAAREMPNGASSLLYNLYADPGYTQVWGDGTSSTVTVPVTFATAGTQTIPVYGRIPKGQMLCPPGPYSAMPQVVFTWN